MRKLVIVIMVIAIVAFAAAGCAETAPPSAPTPAQAEQPKAPDEQDVNQAAPEQGTPAASKKLRFLMSSAYFTAPYCAAYQPSMENKAKELGVEVHILDAAGNQQTALQHATTAITEGYDGFIYLAADVDGATPVIEELNNSGIPWIGSNTLDGNRLEEMNIAYFHGPDSKSHGYTMAQFVLDAFPQGANIVAIEGTAGHNQTIQINNAFSEKLDSSYVFMDKQDCNFQPELAMTKMTDMLTAYGVASKGGKIDCIISHDGGMLTGIISALEAEGLVPGDVKIVACGSNLVVKNALESGWLSATSTQDPMTEGAEVMQMIYDIVTNPGSVQKGWTKLETPMATPETIDQFNWF